MWCGNCQQDVPGIAIKEDGNRICCARCSGLLAGITGRTPVVITDEPPREAVPTETALPKAEAPEQVEAIVAPPLLDDWSLENDLAAVTRMMHTLRSDAPASATAAIEPRRSHDGQPWRMPDSRSPRPTLAPPKRGSWLAWPVLMIGMMTFCCGAVLLGWSFATGRGDLWTFGMPAVLAGQGLLVLGLVVQLEGLWQNNRETRETLDGLDRELAELRHATSVLTSTHTAAGQSFYAHMAEGASPHLLLADVKGQLDVIALRLAQVKK